LTPFEALERSRHILRTAGYEPEQVSSANFLTYAQVCADVVKGWTHGQRGGAERWLKDWALTWRKMRDEFSEMVRKDPMVLYQPKHSVSLAFHKSSAFVRYYRAGNRTSKTQSGYAEHYWVLTGQHPYRHFPPPPNSTFLLPGLTFSQYEGKVFEKKMFTGEEDNPLSPMFPEGGKWFNHWDSKTHTLTVACEDCAEAGKALRCPSYHLKSQCTLLSPEHGVRSLEAFVSRLAHIDEHVEFEYYNAIKQRLASAEHSALIITATPLHGPESWENRVLVKEFVEGSKENNIDEQGNPIVELFEIDQFAAGIVPHWKIRRDMKGYDEFEIQARVYGKPASLAKNPVFDRKKLGEWNKVCTKPKLFTLKTSKDLEELTPEDVTLEAAHPIDEKIFTGLRLWEAPKPGATYIIAVDAASGLAPSTYHRAGDASCASVLRVERKGKRFGCHLVAQYWGWMNPYDYGEEVLKLANFYNEALVVVELTGGHGRGVVDRLKKLFYWNIYRDQKVDDVSGTVDPRLGIDTNQQTKPTMVAALQYLVRENLINVPCSDTIREMVAFEQEMETSTGGRALLTPRYRGVGEKDDRVMSLCIGAFIVVSRPDIYDFEGETAKLSAS
jgi:hypothetical protein